MLEQILWQKLLEGFPDITLLLFGFDISTKAHLLLTNTTLDNLLNAIKGTTTDKENIRRINLDKLLMRMLASALRRHRSNRTFQNLQQSLLHAFTRYITGDGWILRLAGNLVDFVDIDNAAFRFLHIIIRCLNELQEDVFHILTHITGFRKGCSISDGKRNIENPCQRLRQERLTAACGAKHQNVGLLQFHIIRLSCTHINALIVIVNSHGEALFGLVLTDYILVEDCADVLRFWDVLEFYFCFFTELLLNDFIAQFNAFVADIDAGTSNQLSYLLLGLATKRALELTFFIPKLQHDTTPQSLASVFLVFLGRVITSSTMP